VALGICFFSGRACASVFVLYLAFELRVLDVAFHFWFLSGCLHYGLLFSVFLLVFHVFVLAFVLVLFFFCFVLFLGPRMFFVFFVLVFA